MHLRRERDHDRHAAAAGGLRHLPRRQVAPQRQVQSARRSRSRATTASTTGSARRTTPARPTTTRTTSSATASRSARSKGYSCAARRRRGDPLARRTDATRQAVLPVRLLPRAARADRLAAELVAALSADDPNADEALYYANVTQMDAPSAGCCAALDELKLADNTLVFFTCDNGPETLNRYADGWRSHGSPGPLRGMKLHLYEGGIRVPGIVRWPGPDQARAGQRRAGLQPRPAADVLRARRRRPASRPPSSTAPASCRSSTASPSPASSRCTGNTTAPRTGEARPARRRLEDPRRRQADEIRALQHQAGHRREARPGRAGRAPQSDGREAQTDSRPSPSRRPALAGGQAGEGRAGFKNVHSAGTASTSSSQADSRGSRSPYIATSCSRTQGRSKAARPASSESARGRPGPCGGRTSA